MNNNKKEKNKDANILTRKIGLSLCCDIENEKEKKKYIDETYEYLRNSIKAQNDAFNLVTSSVYFAKKLEKSDKEINGIYYQYSHNKPKDTTDSDKFLETIIELLPLTEEKVDNIISDYETSLRNKKKPPKEDMIKKKCDSLRRKYSKYIGSSERDILKKIKLNEEYCAYPKDIYDNFANGMDTPAYVIQQVKDYFKSYNNDIMYGEVAVRNMKKDNPLIVPPSIFYNKNKELIGIVHEYDTDEEFSKCILKENDIKVYFVMPGKEKGEKIKFKLYLGNPSRSSFLRSELKNIIERKYTICGSKIGFTMNKKTKRNTDLTLFLSFSMPSEKNIELDENIVVGVDLGIEIPAMCALNNNEYIRKSIGSKDAFLKIRTQLQKQRKRLSSSLKYTSGGHGRKKKLQALDRFKKRERNFVQTYNHYVSKNVVDFALKHNAKYINLENLTGYDTSKFILRNWSYYELQQYITYKAARYGIVVRKINPCYTSQVCSVCGHWEEGQRVNQASFICKNEECDSNNKDKYKYGLNADFNAARNIAMSTLFMEDGQVTEKSKKEAREYYGIVLDKENENKEC